MTVQIMKKILICGLCNLETSCSVREFPIGYSPVDYNFYGVTSAPSGVGLNLALALTALGDHAVLLSYVGDDPAGRMLRDTVTGRVADPVLLGCDATPQSTVLFDPSGRRKVYTDLKDMQERRIPAEVFARYADADAFCLCNINFSRGLLPLAKATGKPVFCDVHCLSEVHDSYNADFMRMSEVLFLSNENIRGREEAFVVGLAAEYPCAVIVVGMGEHGALLYERGRGFTAVPAVCTRPVVNTVGAGDALFSAFVHFYLAGRTAEEALGLACRFASYKIGESGASCGFLSEEALLSLN